jgi:predicted dehydrogenase
MENIRVGVIGVGRMGKHHCRIYSNLRHVDFVGAYDLDKNALHDVSRAYDVPVIDSIDELLSQVDAVSITTPTPPHFELAMRCLEKGIHVLIEKPITETLGQAEELTEAVESNGITFQVGHIERFNPTYCELKNVLEHMNILAINFRRLSPYQGSNTDVDVVLDLMIHDLDLLLDLTRQEPKSIAASGFNVHSDCLDHVSAQLGYESNMLVTLTASRITEQKIRSIDVVAEGAYIEADLFSKNIFVHRRSMGEYLYPNHGNVKYHQESIVEKIMVPAVEPLFKEIEHFVSCIRSGETPAVTARDGMEALRNAFLIRDAAANEKAFFSEADLMKAMG